MENAQLRNQLYRFGNDMLDRIFDTYEGQTLGSGECSKEAMLKTFFLDFTPIENAKPLDTELQEVLEVQKTSKTKVKKKRELSGYTYFGQQMKTQLNKEIVEIVASGGDKPKYLSYVASKWKALTLEEKDEWKQRVLTVSKQS